MQSPKPSHLGCLFFLLSLQYALLARAEENVSCYLPNGVAIADKTSSTDFYVPCPISAGNDGQYMCCKTSSPFNDVCNVDGLCARQNDSSLAEEQGLLRSTCTDPTWTSPSCLKLCVTGLDYLGNVANDTEQYVKQCDDGSWCCEAQTPPLNDQNVLNSTMQNQVNACCSKGSGVFINNGKVTNTNPSGTSTSASATNSASGTTAATQSPSSPTTSPLPPHNSHTGAIAGGVVGGVAGLVLIVVATFYCRRIKRNPNSMPEDSSGQEMVEAWNLHEKPGNERSETNGTQVAGERNGLLHEKEGDGAFETDGTQVVETDGTQVAGERNGPYEL